jgi:hypothetical protein
MLVNSGRNAGVSSGTALNQIDRRVAAEHTRVVEMEQLADAARKLYATLTDEQKRIADRVLASTVPVEPLSPATPSRSGR